MREIKVIESPDGTRELHFYINLEGFFRFQETYIDTNTLPGYGEYSFWTFAPMSGIYSTFEQAEREAYAMTPWLRETHLKL